MKYVLGYSFNTLSLSRQIAGMGLVLFRLVHFCLFPVAWNFNKKWKTSETTRKRESRSVFPTNSESCEKLQKCNCRSVFHKSVVTVANAYICLYMRTVFFRIFFSKYRQKCAHTNPVNTGIGKIFTWNRV